MLKEIIKLFNCFKTIWVSSDAVPYNTSDLDLI